MARIAPVNAKGTRDFLPRELVRRNRVFSLLRETFEHHGYEPLETPAVENSSVLEGKYGEEGDRLLFRILKRGDSLQKAARTLRTLAPDNDASPGAASLSRTLSDEALRYDLTVPFARVIAAHQSELVLPFRRYQMQPVWRAERPQRGRYREFYQCDVDCVGSRSLTLDAEMVAIHYEVFARLGFEDFVTRINHRGLLRSLMTLCEVPHDKQTGTMTAMDKLDKIGPSGVRSELVRLELGDASIERILELIDFSGTPEAVLSTLADALAESSDGLAAIQELREVFEYISLMGVPASKVKFDASLVRGLGYYTGAIFETILTASSLGALGGGGRYDQLIGQFTGRDLPCVGISFGIERIFDALAELKTGGRAHHHHYPGSGDRLFPRDAGPLLSGGPGAARAGYSNRDLSRSQGSGGPAPLRRQEGYPAGGDTGARRDRRRRRGATGSALGHPAYRPQPGGG